MRLGEDTIEFGGLEDKTKQAVKFGTKSPWGRGGDNYGSVVTSKPFICPIISVDEISV